MGEHTVFRNASNPIKVILPNYELDKPIPSNVEQMRQFVAMGSYNRIFIRDFAEIVRSMVELARK